MLRRSLGLGEAAGRTEQHLQGLPTSRQGGVEIHGVEERLDRAGRLPGGEEGNGRLRS